MKQFQLFNWRLTHWLAVILLCLLAGRVAAAEVVVEIRKMKFHPQEITVKKGTVVRWVNKEKRQYHSVWFKQAGDPGKEIICLGITRLFEPNRRVIPRQIISFPGRVTQGASIARVIFLMVAALIRK